MRKLFLLLGVAVLLAVAVLLTVGFFLGSIVRTAVNRYGPPLTKTRVELASAEISPLTGSGTIRGLVIGNPPGWHSERAVFLGQVHLAIEPRSLFGDHVIVDDILIDQPEFVYETRIIGSNLKDLLKNIESSTSEGSEHVDTAKTDSGQPVRIEVRRFRLQNARVTIGVGPAAVTVRMPAISINDLGAKDGGITANQLAAAVMERVLKQVLLTAADAVGNASKSAGSAATDKTIDATKRAEEELKKLFGGKN
jgi:hypothetical protein